MEKQEMEFLSFLDLCVAERRRGKSVDEIWKAWKDAKRSEDLSVLLGNLTTRELAVLNAALEVTAGKKGLTKGEDGKRRLVLKKERDKPKPEYTELPEEGGRDYEKGKTEDPR